MGADSDAVGDGGGLQMIEAGTGLQVQIGMLRIGNQQSAAFQHAHDAAAEGIEKLVQLVVVGPAGAVEGGTPAEQHVQVGIQVQGRAEALDQGDRASAG
jgi:hypothetical protein